MKKCIFICVLLFFFSAVNLTANSNNVDTNYDPVQTSEITVLAVEVPGIQAVNDLQIMQIVELQHSMVSVVEENNISSNQINLQNDIQESFSASIDVNNTNNAVANLLQKSATIMKKGFGEMNKFIYIQNLNGSLVNVIMAVGILIV